MREFLIEKLIAAVLIFMTGFGFGYYPLRKKDLKVNQTMVSLCNAFAGGLLISAGLFHILPEAVESYHAVPEGEKPVEGGFPWVFFTALVSFLFVYILEIYLSSKAGHSHGPPVVQEHLTIQEGVEPFLDTTGHILESKDTGSFWPIIFALAMGIHSFFAGIGLGLAESRFHVFAFFAAIVLHKWAVALSIGISFVREHKERVLAISTLLIFAMATPSGVIVGTAVEGINNKVNGIMNGVSAGTFIYIGVVEMLGHEFPTNKMRNLKVVLMLLGVGLMVSLFFLEGLAEGDDCNGHHHHHH